MINEIVYADFAWSGDALWAIEEGDYDEQTDTYQLGYYVPKKQAISGMTAGASPQASTTSSPQ